LILAQALAPGKTAENWRDFHSTYELSIDC